MRSVVVGVLLLSATLCTASQALADAKLLAQMGNLFYSSTNVCSNIIYRPSGYGVLNILECTDKASLTGATACATFKALIVNRAAAQYALDLTPDDVVVSNCPQ